MWWTTYYYKKFSFYQGSPISAELALLSGSETFVFYTLQIYYPVPEKPCAARSLSKSAGGPQTMAMLSTSYT